MDNSAWLALIPFIILLAYWRSRQTNYRVKQDPTTKTEHKTPAKRQDETLYATFRKAERQQRSRRRKVRKYFQKGRNLVALATLLFVVSYTCITLGQLILSRRQEVHQLRAYIKVAPARTPPFSTAISFDVVAAFKNVGQTPATEATGFMAAKVLDWPLADDYPFATDEEFSPKIVEMPTIDHELSRRLVPASPDDEDRILGGQSRLVVYGTIFYDDVFGYHRWTDFCYGYDWDALGTGRVQYCNTHNGAE
jgi:hypothetical protein